MRIAIRQIPKHIFEITALVIAWQCWSIAYFTEYARGRFAWVMDVLFITGLWLLAYPLTLILVTLLPYIIGIIIVVFAIFAFRNSHGNLVVSIGFGLLVILISVMFCKITTPTSRFMSPFLRGYADRVRSQVDVATLQDWGVRALESGNLDLPDMGTLTFDDVYIVPRKGNLQSYIMMMNGGNFIGYYGLLIGKKDFSCSAYNYPNTVKYPIAEGMCVWEGPD
jgi:hypothetical protein